MTLNTAKIIHGYMEQVLNERAYIQTALGVWLNGGGVKAPLHQKRTEGDGVTEKWNCFVLHTWMSVSE